MAIVIGTSLNDVLAGTPDPDRIEGGAGNDRINGGAGDDEIFGGVGSDTLTGDAGNDRLFGEEGNDGIYGGGGNDTIDGGIGDDTLIGDGGNDDLFGGAGNDRLYGGVGNDRLDGGLGNDLIFGEAGDDVFVYRSGDGNDTFVGGVGNDRLELQLNSADITEALRSDLAAYQIWAADQVAAAGSSTTLAGQATGDTFSFASLGISISVVEGLTIIVDGQQVALESLLNRAPTEIALSNASIAENASAGTVVGFLSGKDPDAAQSATLTFALAEPSNAFEIVGHELIVKPGSVLDFEANPTVSVNVTATDTGGLSKTQIFTINLEDVNEAPTTVALSSSSVAENEAARSVIGLLSAADPDSDQTSFAIAENAIAGTVIGLLSGTDPDAGQSATLTFALAEPSDVFEVVGNQLVVKPGAVLDFEAQKAFSVHVTATDAGGLSKTQVFTINVSDVNEVLTGGVAISGVAVNSSTNTASLTAAQTIADPDGVIGDVSYQWRMSKDGGVTWTDISGATSVTYTPTGVTVGALIQVTATYADAFGQYTITSPETYIVGNGAANTLVGSAASDVILGLAGNDVIVGFSGADTVDGGSGTDTIRLTGSSVDLDGAADDQIVNVEAITAASATSGVTLDLSRQSEGFTVTGSRYADIITGSAGTDVINAGSGNDLIIGFVGADKINGGGGTDTLQLSETSLDLNGAADDRLISVQAVTAAVATAAVTINLANQSEGFAITGSAFADTLTGGRGNDTFNGFTTGDSLDGAAGTDTLRLSASSADIDAASDAQIVNVEAIAFTGMTAGIVLDLSRQSDGFTVTGTGFADTITGSTGADVINAGSGNDLIIGFVGADKINGGGGTDTLQLTETSADLNSAADDRLISVQVVTAAFAATAVTIDLANQSEGFAITGSAFADNLTGGQGNDTFYGLSDGDTLDGSAGTDTLRLTASSVHVDSASDEQIVNVEAITFAAAASDVSLDLSRQTDGFTITGSGYADTITGSAGADVINAGSGNDLIIGFLGADRINGGSGTDTLQLSGTSADLNSAADSQIISIQAVSAATATQSVVINLFNQSEGFSLTGSAFSDILTGGAGRDTIRAGEGDDTILGFVGSDTVDGGSGYDTLVLNQTSLTLNSASNTRIANIEAISAASANSGVTIDLSRQTDGFSVTGSAWADGLTGSSGRDVISGGAGNDVIKGGAGADMLIGGDGADTFIFSSAIESGTSAATRDQIFDFVSMLENGSEHDVIDLSAIDAIQGGADQAFTFNPTVWDGVGAQFTAAGQLRYQHVTDDSGGASTIISGNTNTNLAADFQIMLAGHVSLTAGDFIL